MSFAGLKFTLQMVYLCYMVSGFELYLEFAMQEKDRENIIKLPLPLWIISVTGLVVAASISLGWVYFWRSGAFYCICFGIFLWAAGGVTALISFLKGGWVTIATMGVQALIVYCSNPHARGIFWALPVVLPGVLFCWKRHLQMRNTAIVALHLSLFSVSWYLGLCVSLFIIPWFSS